MRTSLPAALAALALAANLAHAAPDALEAGFKAPPASAKPHTWWHWVNGNITKEGIAADLAAMQKVGLGGAQIFNVDCGLPSGPVPFMSDQWRELMKFAMEEAGKRGIEICAHNCGGWSSSGGPWVKPDDAMKMLTWSETQVVGGKRFAGSLAMPPSRMGYYKDIAVLAFPTPQGEPARITDIRVKAGFDRADRLRPNFTGKAEGAVTPRASIVDLSGKAHLDGQLFWEVPEGNWTVMRFGYTLTGAQNAPATEEARGLEVDKLDRGSVETFWRTGMMADLLKTLGPLAPRVLNNVLIDSYETGCQNWTGRMRQEFRTRTGYDLLTWLPVVSGRVVESLPESERFLWDFRRVIADLWSESYYSYMADIGKRTGLKSSSEPYGNGIFDNIQAGGYADIPMSEFWVGGGTGNSKLAASIGHVYGRKFVGAESFTADDRQGRWLVDPYSIKALGDAVFCEGVNRYIFHRYAHQPWTGLVPGLTMGPWGTHFERTVTWWRPASEWIRYVTRCQQMLQAGRFSADVLAWVGDDAPNDLLPPSLPAGYDYDCCDTSVLSRATVRNGRIVLPSGMVYRLLVLPDSPCMRPETLKRIGELVALGATVLGPKPAFAPGLGGYPGCDDAVKQIADQVWGTADGKTTKAHLFGKGQVIWGIEPGLVLKGLKVGPDFKALGDPAASRLMSIHRTQDPVMSRDGKRTLTPRSDWWFVSNQQQRAVSVRCSFRVTGVQPELWWPDSGRMAPAAAWSAAAGRTEVQLDLDPAGSVFVVFRKPAGKPAATAVRFATSEPKAAAPQLQVVRATYAPVDGRPGADVTGRVTRMVAAGHTEITASNTVFGDPTPLVVKQLTITYRLNGKEATVVTPENGIAMLGPGGGVVKPRYAVAARPTGGLSLNPWAAGTYTLQLPAGKAVMVKTTGASSVAVRGPWSVSFPTGLGAPPRVALPALISWPDHTDAGVRYFSGTATYNTGFRVAPAQVAPGCALRLDLGRVKNMAEVEVNGKPAGTLWKEPFVVDVTGLVKPGANTLTVKVTNLWPNRLIGDEQLPDEVEWRGDTIARWPDWLYGGGTRPATERVTFTSWRFYRKESPLLESGLLGPVVLESARSVELK
jgi:hypothetical protein